MFERFTPNARHVVVDAQEVMLRLGHDQITTEHLLYGAVVATDSFSADVLAGLGVDGPRVEALLVERYGRKEPPAGTGQVPFTTRARAALGRASSEADELGHAVVGTEHVLLGVAADPQSGAATALASFGVADVRAAVLRRMRGDI